MQESLVQSVLDHEVQPALGCTEPISIALAAARAMQEIGKRHPIAAMHLVVSPGVLKNATGVAIPNTGGMKGCKIAAIIGAIAGDANVGLKVLQNVEPSDVIRAQQLVSDNIITFRCDSSKKDIFISVFVKTTEGRMAIASISGTHINVHCIEIFDESCKELDVNNTTTHRSDQQMDADYKQLLGQCTIKEMVRLAREITEAQRTYILYGVEMNLTIASKGGELKGYGGILRNRNPEDTCAIAACATDARMVGMSLSVMSSGGSGNQGVVAILVPYLEGMRAHVDLQTIIESIALSHLLNAFAKVFLGEIAPICGCATGAGIGAAAALVYQAGGSLEQIEGAINNVVAMTAGLLCDGAKAGCTLKVISASQATMTSATLALAGISAGNKDGLICDSAVQSIKNLALLVSASMTRVDDVIMELISAKHK